LTAAARAAPPRAAPASSGAIGLAVVALVAVFASGLASSPWSCLPDPALGGDLAILTLLAAAFVPAATPSARLLLVGLLAAQLGLIATFLGALDGHLLFTDDHSTFFNRLHVLAARFPDLLYYDPSWNAGRLTTEVFPTGAVLLHLLAAPFLLVMPLADAYGPIVGTIAFVVCPLLVALAASLLGLGARSALVAGFFSLLPSLLVARWAFKYGAVPFVVVSHAAPLVYALALRVATDDRRWLAFASALVLVLSLALLWSGAVFLLTPVGLLAFLDRRGTLRGRARLAGVALVAAGLNAWWILEYVSHVPVFDFVSKADALGSTPPRSRGTVTLAASARALLAALQKTNPILLAFLPVAFLARESRGLVVRVSILAGVFVAIAVVGPQLKRHLELDRMALAASLCLAIAAAVAASHLWRSARRAGALAPAARGLVVATLLVTFLGARGYARNESVERFGVLGPEVEALVAEIRARSTGGRTYIAGFVLHEFSGGHAAALAPLAGVEMVAVEPSHRFWRFHPPLPPAFRDRWESVHRYLALLNVDLVVTKDREWREAFDRDPELERVWNGGRYALFRFRGSPRSWFLEGEGRLEAAPNRLRVTLATERVVLRYRYVPGLAATGGAVVEPATIEGIDWIAVRGTAGRTIDVGYP
jgi:hypothetical protein